MIVSIPDLFGIVFFLIAWFGYRFLVERQNTSYPSLNTLMDKHRMQWMLVMAERDQRMVDSSIMGSLQNGTAFFASTSLIALGTSAALLRAADDALKVFS